MCSSDLLKSKRVDPISEKSQAFQEFTKLLYHAKQIIAGLYQHDEEEKGGDKAVSYTHLDVYKRQQPVTPSSCLSSLTSVKVLTYWNTSCLPMELEKEWPIQLFVQPIPVTLSLIHI